MKNIQWALLTASIITAASSFVVAQTLPSPQIISQKNRTYAPGNISIKLGDSIRIVNDDVFLHHAYIKTEYMKFDSGSIKEGQSVDVQFDQIGVFPVKCQIHPKMKLVVEVE